MATPEASARVEMGQEATVRGTTRAAGNVLGGAPAMDSWDSWNIDRDLVINNAQSWSYTNRYFVGSEDLDVYGHWVNVPDYGKVWSPTARRDWSPYRAGRWVWEPYWGWTWVSHVLDRADEVRREKPLHFLAVIAGFALVAGIATRMWRGRADA